MIVYPGLSNWEKNPVIIADRLLTDMFLAEKSQTYVFGDNVTSFPFIIQNYAKNIDQMCTAMRLELTKYFERYFLGEGSFPNDYVNIEVREKTKTSDFSKVELIIYIKFVYQNIGYDYGKIIEVNDNKIQKVTNLNNYQPEY